MRFLLIIAVAQWLSLQAEISVADWSSVLMKEDLGIAVGPNGYGYTTFCIVQLVARLAAPRWVDRYGLNTVVRVLGVIGAVGYLAFLTAATLADSPGKALVLMCISYGFISLGAAVMQPGFASAAGAIPGLPSARALMITGAVTAVISVFGRIALAYLAQFTSLPLALGVMGLFLLGAALMSQVLHPHRAAGHAIAR